MGVLRELTVQPGFGRRLRRGREDAGYTAAQLGALVGLHPTWIYELEGGRRGEPTLGTALRLARALQVSLDWLASGAEHDPDAHVAVTAGFRARRTAS